MPADANSTLRSNRCSSSYGGGGSGSDDEEHDDDHKSLMKYISNVSRQGCGDDNDDDVNGDDSDH